MFFFIFLICTALTMLPIPANMSMNLFFLLGFGGVPGNPGFPFLYHCKGSAERANLCLS